MYILKTLCANPRPAPVADAADEVCKPVRPAKKAPPKKQKKSTPDLE